MAGIQNKIPFGNGIKILPSSSADIADMQEVNSISQINTNATPEAAVSANIGSIAQNRVAGTIYIKQTGTGNTGWSQIVTLNSAPTFTGNVTSQTKVIAPYDSGTAQGFYFSDGRSAMTQIGSARANFFGGNAGNSTMSGIANIGFGQAALASLTTANQNTAFGNGALGSATTGSNNTAHGYLALQLMTTGTGNVACGWGALGAVVSTNYNTALGMQTLQNCTGTSNACVGYMSGLLLTSGNQNTALGTYSLNQIATGVGNIALGYEAGFGLRANDSNNIDIGNTGVSGDNGVIRIGANATHTTAFMQGISGVTVTGAAVLIQTDGQMGTVVSSERYKYDIEDMKEKVSILDLKPVSFKYKNDDKKRTQYGLIAEDVHKKMPYLCLYNDKNEPESVKYHELCTFLLHEVKKLASKIEKLESR